MDIPSFLSLLIEECLVFVRADLFEDKYEGIWPKMTALQINTEINNHFRDENNNPIYENIANRLNEMKKGYYLNSWCMENHQMFHMWKIYSKENGVAIETSYERLKAAIEDEKLVYPSEVNYVDFNDEAFDWKGNAMTVYTVKRKEYKAESEFRLILPDLNKDNFFLQPAITKIKINVYELISKIHVSPYAPNWYYDLVTAIIKKFNFKNLEIVLSDL